MPKSINADGAVAANHDIARLHVAMDDTSFVHVLEHLTNQAGDAKCIFFRTWRAVLVARNGNILFERG
jgi:hypothetical protein